MKLSGRTAALVSLEGLPTIHITTGVVLVGRSEECDVLIDSKRISRKHCCIALVGDKLVIKDLGSTNGCRVNGQKGDELTAREGDDVVLGDSAFRFCWDHPSDMTIKPVSMEDAPDSVIEPATTQKSKEGNKDRANGSKLDSSDPLMHLPGLA
jgi:pSer/pThr/pTyr-binding forkhead associated (FHA) protein